MTYPYTSVLDPGGTNAGPPPSASWINASGLDGMVTLSGQFAVDPAASGGVAAALWGTQMGADCEVYSQIPTRCADNKSIAVIARSSAPPLVDGYVFAVYRDDAGGDYVEISDSDGALDSWEVDYEDGDQIGLRCSGSVIHCWYYKVATDWVELGSVVSTATETGGYIGMAVAISTPPDADDLATRLDNFGGGNLGPIDWDGAARHVSGKLEINWSKDGSTWVDESAYLTSAPGATWTYKAELFNTGDRFSPTNTDGALYADIGTNKGHGVPMRFSMGIDDGAGGYTYTRVFTGVVDKMAVTSTASDRVRVDCLDNAHPLMQNRRTTVTYLDDRVDEWITTLATLGGVASTSLMAGLRIVPFLWIDDDQIWGEMNKAAHSEGGFVYFNQSGTLVFENAEAWLSETRHNTSQHTFTVSRFKDLALNFDWSNTYNRVIVQYQPRAIKGRQVVWTIEQADRLILPGQTKELTARFRKPCVAVFTPVANSDYHIISATGRDLTGDMAVSVTAYAQRATVEIVSSSAYQAASIFDFQLRGIPLDGYPAGQVIMDATDADIGSSATYPKVLNIAGNEYIQTPDQAALVATMLRDRVKKARLTYSIKGQPGIPSLIPGDRVTVVESGSEVDNEGFIMQIVSRYTGGNYVMDVEVLDATNWFPYSDYFELDVDALGTPSHKVFY